jgi:hypothetical protein
MKGKTKKRKTKGVEVVSDTINCLLAFELDGDSRCAGDACLSGC